jgi:serine/threonine protein kinase
LDLDAIEIWSKLGAIGASASPAVEGRYSVQNVLGVGSTGQVYAVLDRNLERQVAIKVLKIETAANAGELANFIEEAKITAALKHPNVLQVLDIDVTKGGRPYFSMGKVDGRTLGDFIAESTPVARHPRLASFNGVVSIFIDICDAIAFAHHRRIVHQDVKPDNILVGDFGEVLVLDWGCARRFDGDSCRTSIYGTPLYMSPEQARQEWVGPTSDVYCIAGSLFHALTLRPPIWADDPDEFWRRKRAGEIDLPSAAERAAVPAELVAIALKALAADPADRYPTVGEMRADLERYQAGLAISARRNTRLQSALRWYRRNRRAVWSWSCASAVFIALMAILFAERLKEIATWGPPTLTESFADDSWKERWTVCSGSFATRDGGVVTTGEYENILLYPQRLSGATAIEYDAEILPTAAPGDLSVYWAAGIDRSSPSGKPALVHPLGLQIGAYDGSYTAIVDRAAAAHHCAYNDFHPVPGKRYRIRDEIVDNRVTVSVDGHVLCDYTSTFPLTGGYLALFGYYQGKSFRDLRIYSLGTPLKVPATAIGDSDAQEGRFEIAAEKYDRVVRSHPGTALGEEALYKEGLCWFRAGKPERADEAWRSLTAPKLLQLARLHRLDTTFADHQHERVLTEMAALCAAADDQVRKRVARQWAMYADQLKADKADGATLSKYVALHDRWFADDPTVDNSAADCLLALGRARQVVDQYPRQRLLCAEAFHAMDQDDVVIRDYPDQRMPYFLASFLTGRFDLLHREALAPRRLLDLALIEHGQAEQVAGREGASRSAALLTLGRFDELERTYPTEWTGQRALILTGHADQVTLAEEVPFALLAQDRLEEVEARFPQDDACQVARLSRGLAAAIAGDSGSALPLLGTTAEMGHELDVDAWVAAFVRELIGDGGAVERSASAIMSDEHSHYRLMQRPWHEAKLLTGGIDEAGFMLQPSCRYARSRFLLLAAITDERAGRNANATARYLAWLELPPFQRATIVDPFRERFVRWRISALSR